MRIGVFDSGVGGLTVLRAIRERFDKVDIFYLGDTARVPYGNKSPETVVRYSLECAEFLLGKGIEVMVVACNTASSYALDELRAFSPVPVIGVVEPGVRAALKRTKGKVGVIGTRATISSGSYQRLLERSGVEVFSKACPLFVPLVEEGLVEGSITEGIVRMYLSEFLDMGIDTLILGCTHYPLLKKVIGRVLEGIEIIDSSEAVAVELDRFVKNEGNSLTELYFTDRSQNLGRLVEIILGNGVEPKILSGGVHKA